MNLPKMSFTVLDTETTGLIPRTNRIIEFASLRVEGGCVTDEYEQLFSIGEDIPPVTRILTRIHDEHLQRKHPLREKKEEIMSHIGTDTVILGQNVGFDIAMLKGEGIDLSDRPWIDTSMIASLVFPELESYSLGYMSQILKLNHRPIHRALGDVHATLELLERCWERLQELPEDLVKTTREIANRSMEAYKEFFGALPMPKHKKQPPWLQRFSNRCYEKKGTIKHNTAPAVAVRKPQPGIVDLMEEPLDPGFLQEVINACSEDTSTVHWIAVKNLESTIRRLKIPKNARILFPPFLLPDRSSIQTFVKQRSFTADEATLALKLMWYEPKSRTDIPIHGDERSVWYGKIACVDSSEEYIEQFDSLPSTLILDHRQLLAFLANEGLMAKDVFGKDPHIVINDASMLEDAATKAYGWFCSLETLRAAAEGNDLLTHFVDILALWIEKIRAFQDTRIMTLSDLHTQEAHGLRGQLEDILLHHQPVQLRSILLDLKNILNSDNISGRVTWIEQQYDKAPSLQSVPDRVSEFLKERLYDSFPITLFIPPESSNSLKEILPPQTTTELKTEDNKPKTQLPLSFPSETSPESVLKNPPPGKSILLISGRNTIEKCFIQFTENLENEGINLFCQGFGGGHDRLQAEFLAAESPSILILSPWRYESVELPEGTVRRLFISSLPFDNPSGPVFARRAEHYRDAFAEYSLPRLENRLFRMIRTFCRHKTDDGEVHILDERIRTKKYGSEIQKYLEQFSREEKKEESQLQMF